MIRAEFFTFSDGSQAGFRIGGHAEAGEAGSDPVCAAVSSAAYLTANTITDVIGAQASAQVKDGCMECRIAPEEAASCAAVLKGLRLHLSELRRQYPRNIRIFETEV